MDRMHLIRTLIRRDGLSVMCSCGCCRIRISAPFDEWEWTALPTRCPKPFFFLFFFPSQMSRLIYFNESFWLRRETSGALQLLLIHLGTVWICLLWFCFLLTLHQVTKESDLPVLVKIAKFAYSENFIIWHACDVGMLDDSQHTGTQIARLLVDNIWKQVSQILDRQGSSVAQPHSTQFPGRSPVPCFLCIFILHVEIWSLLGEK